MRQLLILISAIIVAQPLFAHEGHDQAPGIQKASHGGTALVGKEINLEYIVSSNEVKLFPLTRDGKDIPSEKVKLSATAMTPKGKPEILKVTVKDGAFLTTVDFKNAYRVEVIVRTETNGKRDSFKFQVEK